LIIWERAVKIIHHVFDTLASEETLWRALTEQDGLAGWWSTRVATSDSAGSKLVHFTFGGDFNPVMEVVRCEDKRELEWRCVAGHDKWKNNTFRFQLAPLEDGRCRLRFWQDYAVELSDDDYGNYNFNWGYYLDSLRLFCEIGTGKPFDPDSPGAGSALAASKAVARRLVESIFNAGDMQVFDELFADQYVNHNMPVPGIPGTKAGFKQVVEATRHAFPDVRVHIQDMVAEGNLVVFHDTAHATSAGDFLGVPPNGKALEWTEIHFLRVANSQIVEHWNNFDQLGLLRQLGAIPPA
jgi:steroid delta-isomerase-like uncharacterized protein